jgi:hypothetical protein
MAEPLPRYPMPDFRWGPWRARVARVIDGDTIRLEVDHGHNAYRVLDIRLMNVAAPEIRGPEREAGERAKAWAEIWCADAMAGGAWPLLVVTFKESFTRYIGLIWRADTGACINEDITKAGVAAWNGA